MQPNEMLWQIVSGGVVLLGTINAYFIQSLIKKIDESSAAVSDFKKDLAFLNEKLSQVMDLSARLLAIEKQIAILDYKILQSMNNDRK